MLPCRVVIVGLFYCFINTADTQHRNKALLREPYPLRHMKRKLHELQIGHTLIKPVSKKPWRCFVRGGDLGIVVELQDTLFPAASRIKRGTMVNPTFQKSLADVNLLFEILLSGLQFGDRGQFAVKDAELASLRKTANLEVICTDIVPRKLTEIRRLTSHLSNHIGYLHQDDFERTLLTMVYTTQHMVNSTTDHQRDIWSESFVSLYKAIKKDLTETK